MKRVTRYGLSLALLLGAKAALAKPSTTLTGIRISQAADDHTRVVFDLTGERIATLATGRRGISILLGDMTGDGISDVSILTDSPPALHIFKNERGTRPAGPVPLGCGVNFTLY